MTKTQSILAAIRERASKATAGEWRAKENKVLQAYLPEFCFTIAHCGTSQITDPEQQAVDADFIAHARTDVPALCAALERALETVDKWAHAGYRETALRDIERILSGGESL